MGLFPELWRKLKESERTQPATGEAPRPPMECENCERLIHPGETHVSTGQPKTCAIYGDDAAAAPSVAPLLPQGRKLAELVLANARVRYSRDHGEPNPSPAFRTHVEYSLSAYDEIAGIAGQITNGITVSGAAQPSISEEELALALHEDWCATMRSQGHHGPREKCTNKRWSGCNGEAGMGTNCRTYSRFLTAWDKLDNADKSGWLSEATRLLSLPGISVGKKG